MLSISIALNALSDHGACTAVSMAIIAIVVFLFSSIQTLGRISWVAWIGAGCIIISGQFLLSLFYYFNSPDTVFIVTIAVGLQGRPSSVPANDVEWKSDYKIVNHPTFTEGISAISTLIFCYAGTPAFFNIAAEMRDPHQYTRALTTCQITVTLVYIIIGIIVYYFCGSHVASPALGSAGPLIKKVSYGIALPGLLASAILMSHVSVYHMAGTSSINHST